MKGADIRRRDRRPWRLTTARGLQRYGWTSLVLGGILIVLAAAGAASANAAFPVQHTTPTATLTRNSDGTVTVHVQGKWIWPFGTSENEGIDATATHPCDSRFGAGWAVVWNDPDDPGYTETYHDPGPSTAGPHVTIGVGSKGVIPSNLESEVLYDHAKPCGTFTQTNSPARGDGFVSGTWSATHTYPSSVSLPSVVCVILYDIIGDTPSPSRINLRNNDNSVAWSLKDTGAWNQVPGTPDCGAVPTTPSSTTTTTTTIPKQPTTTTTTVPKNSTTTTTVAPVTKSSSSSTTTTAPPPSPVTAGSSSLAFTGVGSGELAFAVAGFILLIAGVAMKLLRREALRGGLSGRDGARRP